MPENDFCIKLIKRYHNHLNQQLKIAPERCKDISEILNFLSKYGFELEDKKDLVRIEFLGSVQRYVFGFYEDAIYHSCFATEQALLQILDEKLTDDEKEEVYERINHPDPKKREFFGFRQIIKLCKDKKLIESKTAQLANKINAMRNAHLHSQNIMSAHILQFRQFRKVPRIIQLFLYKKYPQTKVIVSCRDLKWCTREDVRKQVETSIARYFSETRRALFGLHARELVERFSPNYYFKKRAEKALDISHTVLKNIGYF